MNMSSLDSAEFFAAVDAAIDVIEENFIPLSPLPEEAGDTGARRLILERFPYDIVAIELPEEAVGTLHFQIDSFFLKFSWSLRHALPAIVQQSPAACKGAGAAVFGRYC